jgi:hypothetical protein
MLCRKSNNAPFVCMLAWYTRIALNFDPMLL